MNDPDQDEVTSTSKQRKAMHHARHMAKPGLDKGPGKTVIPGFGKKKGKSFAKSGPDSISGAIKRPGALTKVVGGKPSQNPGAVNAAASGAKGPLAQKEALFYKNVLAKK